MWEQVAGPFQLSKSLLVAVFFNMLCFWDRVNRVHLEMSAKKKKSLVISFHIIYVREHPHVKLLRLAALAFTIEILEERALKPTSFSNTQT